jgi:hypothetical protein
LCSYPRRSCTTYRWERARQSEQWFIGYLMRSRTSCREVMCEIESASISAAIEKDYVHAAGVRWARQSQQVVLQLLNEITYNLQAGDGRDKYKVREWCCSYPMRSRTGYNRSMGKTESASGTAAIQRDHIQAAGGQWVRQNQQVFLQLSNRIPTSCTGAMGEIESAGGSAVI